jgi:hypothetical protein
MREGDSYNLVGATGTLIDLHADGFASPGYVTCVIELDKPILDYIVRATFFEAKIERIVNDDEGISACTSTKE